MNTSMLHLPRVNSLSDYMEYLREQMMPVLIQEPVNIEDELVHAVTHLLKGKLYVCRRVCDVKRIIEHTCDRWVGRSMLILFPLYMRETAYMTDAGEISVSLCFLHSSSGFRVLKILLHELAHWWIAQQSSYASLIALDKEYLALHGTDGENLLLSPIEYLATILSIDLMVNLANALDPRSRGQLLSLAADEKQRVKTAIFSLCL